MEKSAERDCDQTQQEGEHGSKDCNLMENNYPSKDNLVLLIFKGQLLILRKKNLGIQMKCWILS